MGDQNPTQRPNTTTHVRRKSYGDSYFCAIKKTPPMWFREAVSPVFLLLVLPHSQSGIIHFLISVVFHEAVYSKLQSLLKTPSIANTFRLHLLELQLFL